ncbi:MAG TPA: hypothetical protein EYP16_01640 [Candidatus Atribacteria bacterium]|nr:hypothetical protein [Candidatus Atribacteria bacterium]
MSIIVRAKIIAIKTSFIDEEILLQSLERCNIKFVKTSKNAIKLSELDITFIRKNGKYVAVFEELEEVEEDLIVGSSIGETVEIGRKRMSVNKVLSDVKTEYLKIIKERIEETKKISEYKEKMLKEIQLEKDRKKQEILLERKRKNLERLKKKMELERQKEIQEKVDELKEKARRLGYSIEEKVEKNERILVLVRR